MSRTQKILIVFLIIIVITFLAAVFYSIQGNDSKYGSFIQLFTLLMASFGCFFYLRTAIEGDIKLRRLGKYIIGILTSASFVLDYARGATGAAKIGYFLVSMYTGILCFLFYSIGYCIFQRRNHKEWSFIRIIMALLFLILSVPVTVLCLLATIDSSMPTPEPRPMVVDNIYSKEGIYQKIFTERSL